MDAYKGKNIAKPNANANTITNNANTNGNTNGNRNGNRNGNSTYIYRQIDSRTYIYIQTCRIRDNINIL